MTRGVVSTHFGEPLSAESKKLINEVRLKISQPIHPNFDNDCNIYRFVLSSERVLKKKKEIVETAAKALNNHLRMRKAFNLDNLPEIPCEEIPVFSRRLLPYGKILDSTDACNRLLWYVDYETMNVEAIAYLVRSSDSIRVHFYHFEQILRKVNRQEEKTGRLSGVRHICDLNRFEINPFTMIFATNGSLTYFSQLMHFENYPELVSPIEMVNTSKWIHVPYKIVRTMMPDGFTERFRIHDGNFLPILLKEIKIEDIPVALGGKNEEIKCLPALKQKPEDYTRPLNADSLVNLETIVISPRRRRQFYVDIKETGKKLQWYYTTDGDIYFGVFYEPQDEILSNGRTLKGMQDQEIDCDELEMVYPWLRLAAKLVPEADLIDCKNPGRYWFIICNKCSWLHRKTINLIIQIVDKNNGTVKRCHSDGTFSQCSEPLVIDFL